MSSGSVTVGIEALGVAIPVRRLPGALLRASWGSGGSATRSVAAHDQDAVTLAVDAAFDTGVVPSASITELFLASTTSALEDGGNVNQLAVGCDLSEAVHAAELGGSLGAGAHQERLGAGAGTQHQQLLAGLRRGEPAHQRERERRRAEGADGLEGTVLDDPLGG